MLGLRQIVAGVASIATLSTVSLSSSDSNAQALPPPTEAQDFYLSSWRYMDIHTVVETGVTSACICEWKPATRTCPVLQDACVQNPTPGQNYILTVQHPLPLCIRGIARNAHGEAASVKVLRVYTLDMNRDGTVAPPDQTLFQRDLLDLPPTSRYCME